MKKNKLILFLIFSIYLVSCNSNNSKFPTEKRYWTTNDYVKVIPELKYGFKSDEKLPSFNDPKTRLIVEKFTDPTNYKIVLDDKELGLKYKNEVSIEFFRLWKDMNSVYSAIDRKDMFIYEKEMIKVWHFGLGLELRYFKLGNDVILESSDDPNSNSVQRIINSNIETLISNFNIYLDGINDEKSLTNLGIVLFSEGIDKYFTELVELYPDANYSGMLRKIYLMEKKSNSEKIKSSLNNLKMLIESKNINT